MPLPATKQAAARLWTVRVAIVEIGLGEAAGKAISHQGHPPAGSDTIHTRVCMGIKKCQ
jgi:hypothetical protein